MSRFLDIEAEVSSEDEFEIQNPEDKDKKKQKVVDSSEEEEDDEEMREEINDIIDDDSLSDSDDSDISGGKKRKRSDDEELDDRLEDDDFDLIEENLGVKIDRKRKFKRIRRIGANESKGQQRRTTMDIDSSSDEDDEEKSEEKTELVQRDVSDSETEATDDDFINDDIIDDELPIGARKRNRRVVSSNIALQVAHDTFGGDFDYNEFSKYDDEEYNEEEEGDNSFKIRNNATKKSIFEVYEPSELKRGFFTDMDNQIRNTDIPERMQLREVPITAVPEDSKELDEEAEWIYKQAFLKPTISIQDADLSAKPREKQKKRRQTVAKIKKALDFMRNQQLEVPFIAFYRKEYVQPELNINDLWKVYKYDGEWCQLKERKEKLTLLFEKMRSYQLDLIMKDPDAPIPDNVRVMKDSDFERLKSIQTPEELQDVYNHFSLYYANDIPVMQAAWRAKERQRKKEEKKQARLKAIAESEEGSELPPEVENDEEREPEPETLKAANRNGSYTLCSKAGLDGLAKRFGLTPEHFAENLRDNYQRHEVDQEAIEPSDLAAEYICPSFSTVEEVLQATKYMVTRQLGREPLVRKCVREVFFERAKICVQPTKKGFKMIDETHNCYSMKYVKDKPVRDLTGDQFLKLCLAEEENLLTITINENFKGNTSNSFIDEVKQLYLKDEFSKNVQDWNDLRSECVEHALKKCVLPDLRNELKRALLAEAKEFVLKACCRKLYNWIKIAPYTVSFPDEDEDEWDTSRGVRVMSVAYVPDYSQAAFACIAAPEGDITDYLRLPHLTKRKNSWRVEEKLMKESDLTAIRNFIMTKKPHVVCIGGESREALMIADDIKAVIADLVENEQFPTIKVEIIDNQLAKIYANSNKGVNDFRDYPELLRQAISLARQMQDPLVEYSQLCNGDEEILNLRLHSLQDQIDKDVLLEAINLQFVNRTNEVGVDVNIAVQYAHKSNLLQFICGLGTRKGAALLRILKQTNQRLENRTQLVTACHMGPKVFINCSGFIKIDTNSLGDSTEAYVEILDGSRVHPETYNWARKMAVDALDYDDDEETNPAEALEEILEAPERLKDLDLDAFAEELERQGVGNKSITLYDIRAELNCRYKDLRTPFRSANAEELFDILTKETPETFYIGKMVTAKVIGIARRKPKGEQLNQANPVRNDDTGLWKCPFCLKNDFPELSYVWNHFDSGSCPGQAMGIKLALDNGISGFIYIKNISDDQVANPEDRVKIGQLIQCRIMKIDVERYSVDCTSKSSDIEEKKYKWRLPRDPYYDQDKENSDLKAETESKANKQRQAYLKRVIVHPSFQNISLMEAEKCLANMDQGEVIIRPSSKGADYLTITWKVTDGIYQHIDIKEEGKTNAFSIGKRLIIGGEEFEDLDEIIARHITPMAYYARDILHFRYYKDMNGAEKYKTEAYIREAKMKDPSKIHYVISASKTFPGCFMLSYLPRETCGHEMITVNSNGFCYRGQMFDRINQLVDWFKAHYREPIPGAKHLPNKMQQPPPAPSYPGRSNSRSYIHPPYIPIHPQIDAADYWKRAAAAWTAKKP
ncbi:transcription elongation factor SPT6-like [Harmonia axyridis]|uniref:transcription elongation factor SPT6-like n=1 Tax=Harmonia axyridis TaxID=115357 RepID=UPI001E279224|nr:transcription elongation factor SPT6-like [Harmonia axyridis]